MISLLSHFQVELKLNLGYGLFFVFFFVFGSKDLGFVMAGFDDDNKALVVGEWFNCRTNHKKRLKAELEREYSSFKYIKNEDSLQTSFQETPSCSRGALRERIAARSGFNAPRVNTEDIFQSTCLTISSPGLSPATLLESPVFLSNPLVTFSFQHFIIVFLFRQSVSEISSHL